MLPPDRRTIHDGGVYVPYFKEKSEKRKPTSFHGIVVAHAKAVPDPSKYGSLTRWPKPGKSALPQEAKVTFLEEAIK